MAARPGGGPLDADSARLVVGALLDYRFYSPSPAVLDDLISSGNLGLIRSPELRRALMGYVQARERLQVAEERERDFAAQELEPYLSARLTLNVPPPDASGIGPAVEPAQLPALLADPRFRTLAYLRRGRGETVRRFAETLGGWIQAVLDALEG